MSSAVKTEEDTSATAAIEKKYLAVELSDVARQTMAYISFPYDTKFLTRGFVVLLEKYGKLRPWPRPGVLATKLIERSLHWQKKRKGDAKDPRLYAWPPGFQKHRDTLRPQERLVGKQERERARVAV